MSTGGGSGGSGSQQYNWNDTLAPEWANAISWAHGLTDANGAGAYRKYPGQRIAGINPDQQGAMDATRDFTWQLKNPAGAINSAIDQTQGTLNGDYLTGAGANPYSRNNPTASASSSYAGNSPQFQGLLHQGQEDITNAYNRGTSADTTRMFNLAGAFGGSAHQNAVANNEYGLAKGLGNYTAGMQNDQYNRSANLEQQDLARQGQLNEGFLNRGSGNYENERQRQMGMVGQGQGLQNQAYDRAQHLMGIGDIQRGLSQDQLNLGYQDWQDQQNHPYRMLDTLTGILSRAQGGMAPNSYTQNAGYSASPFSQLLGGGLLASQFMR